MWYNERIATNALDEQKFQEDKTMAVVKELLRAENDGTLSFGDYTLGSKTKLDGFEFQGDIYKVKTLTRSRSLKRTACSYTNPCREQR